MNTYKIESMETAPLDRRILGYYDGEWYAMHWHEIAMCWICLELDGHIRPTLWTELPPK